MIKLILFLGRHQNSCRSEITNRYIPLLKDMTDMFVDNETHIGALITKLAIPSTYLLTDKIKVLRFIVL